MKLIFCPICQDIKKLTDKHAVECECGRSWGIYLDEINAEYGGQAIPLGIANASLAVALKNRPTDSTTTGSLFDAFVIPSNCASCVKVGKSREEMSAERMQRDIEKQKIPLKD
jgi:hypothetical protein